MAAGSVDLIAAAQAFHWFDLERARAEFLRVLRPDAPVALVWNDRVLADPLHQALNEVFAQFATQIKNGETAGVFNWLEGPAPGGNCTDALAWTD